MNKLRDYEGVVGTHVLDELELCADRLSGISVRNINSTAVGGGVAEILIRLVPLLQELGIQASWDVIKAGERFFEVTKKIHNALHGVPNQLTSDEEELFLSVNETNAQQMDLGADVLFVHDPQPVALVRRRADLTARWLWRCHIDFSNPDPSVWEFLRQFVQQYDAGVISAPSFARDLPIPQVLISPSIDPLSEKNKDVPADMIDATLERFGIDRKRHILTQISRFDYLKDPVGVIRAFRLVRKYIDCQLVLAGGSATDDPEGARVLEDVKNEANEDPDIFLLLLPPASDIEINCLQRASTIVLQKSLREGFGLTVTEALWKAKPVIASAVGGIPLQITNRYSGLLTHTIEGTAHAIKQLLQEPAYARRLGENGREHVRKNFLITRHLRDHLLLFLSLRYPDQDVVHL